MFPCVLSMGYQVFVVLIIPQAIVGSKAERPGMDISPIREDLARIPDHSQDSRSYPLIIRKRNHFQVSISSRLPSADNHSTQRGRLSVNLIPTALITTGFTATAAD